MLWVFCWFPHCTVCKMQHNLEGISCPERGFVPNVTLLRYFFFFQSLSTPCSNVTSQRDTTLFPTRTAFFINAQILWRTQKNSTNMVCKGQKFSKANFHVRIWTKNRTKLFSYFCPKDLKWFKWKKKAMPLLY